MAGTRLAVHSIFVVQLICLVAVSFFYASSRPFNPDSSAEPFISDQSGWKILVEDVSLVPLHDSDGGYIREYFDAAMAMVNNLLVGEVGQVHPHSERRTSVFVQQMRQKISNLPLKIINNADRSVTLPQLKMNVHMPMIKDFGVVKRIALEFELATEHNSANKPSRGIIFSPSATPKGASSEMKSCDEWVLPESIQTHYNVRKLKLPDIHLLTGCKKTSVDVPDMDAIVIRTTHTENDINGLEQFLRKEISPILLKIVYQASTQKQTHRLERMTVQLVDEDPSSHKEIDAKIRFELLSQALSSSLQATVGPIINDLSFVYGGDIELLDDEIMWKSVIDLVSAPSAYLSLPNDAIEREGDEGVNEKQDTVDSDDIKEREEIGVREFLSKKSVTTEKLSRFIQIHSSSIKGLEWFLLVPSRDHSPLTIRDGVSGDSGDSIVLFDSKPAGLSLVQIDDLRYFDSDESHNKYVKSVSRSLNYLAGYIRELNGLQSQSVMETNSTFLSERIPVNYIGGSNQQQSITFWELESIAQKHWYRVLERVLNEIDAVFSLLNEHGSTLALPVHVAEKINTATHILRKSISFAQDGLPAMYATSALYGALAAIESVQADADLVELPYFAPDHFLAVFSPLVLPLVMPMIFGLIREVKRYKELKKKRRR